MIVTDDSKTAPLYFTPLKKEVRKHVTIELVPLGEGPSTVLKEAISRQHKLKAKQDGDNDDHDSVWVLLDTEYIEGRRREARDAAREAHRHHIKPALSDPCFELWTLLHLKDTGRGFATCKDVWRALKKAWENEFKSVPDSKTSLAYERIIGRRTNAAKRARNQHARGAQSYTEVYRLIEAIESICRRSNPLPENRRK